MSAKPEVVVLHRIYTPTLAELEARYTVHKLWLATDREAMLRDPHLRAGLNVHKGKVTCREVAHALGYTPVDALEALGN